VTAFGFCRPIRAPLTVLSAVPIESPQEPAAAAESFGGGDLIRLYRVLIHEMQVSARRSGSDNDHRQTERALDPDALLVANEEPG
jgi:hypothetical protein